MTTNSSLRVVPCQIGKQQYCFDASAIRTVQQSCVCDFFDEPLEGVVGQTEINDNDVPVFRLRQVFDISGSTVPSNEHLIVLTTNQGECGFLVDSVYRAVDIDASEIYPLSFLASSPFFHGITPLRGTNRGRQFQAVEDGDAISAVPTLFVAPDGIIGTKTDPPYEIQQQNRFVDGANRAGRRGGQIMMFDVPDTSIDDQSVSIGFSVTQILEVTQDQNLIGVPNSSRQLIGLLPWRDHFVPVVDLSHELQFESLPSANKNRIVIVRDDANYLLAFPVSDHIQSVRLPIESAPYEAQGLSDLPCVSASFATKDRVLIIPQISQLLGNGAWAV